MIVKLLIKEVEDCVGLLDHIQEVQVGIFGIRRWDGCVINVMHNKCSFCFSNFLYKKHPTDIPNASIVAVQYSEKPISSPTS